ILVPKVSLDELYDQRVAGWLEQQGVVIHRQSAVVETTSPEIGTLYVEGFLLADGSRHECDFMIFAVPWKQLESILHPRLLYGVDRSELAQISSASIS